MEIGSVYKFTQEYMNLHGHNVKREVCTAKKISKNIYSSSNKIFNYTNELLRIKVIKEVVLYNTGQKRYLCLAWNALCASNIVEILVYTDTDSFYEKVQCFCNSVTIKEEEDHTGMVWNPIDQEWKWGLI